MARLRLLPIIVLLVLVSRGAEVAANIPAEAPSWTKDLRTVGYPAHLSEALSKTFGTPPTKLAFADREHVVVTFISSDASSPSEHEGTPASFRLRLHAIVFEARTGQVEIQRDWPNANPNDGVIAAHDGKVIVRSGTKLALFSTELEVLKEIDTAPRHARDEGLFAVLSSPTGRFLLLEFSPGGVHAKFDWMNADTLETLHSFSDSLGPQAISDSEVASWRIPLSRPSELVIRTPDEPGRVIHPDSRGGPVAFVKEDTIAIKSTCSRIQLIRTDGKPVESISPHAHEYLSRITPSAQGQRFAFTGSRIRNTQEILEPQQTWEYVQRVHVYDMSSHSFVGNVNVRHSTKNEDFPLALSPDGSMLAFLEAETLQIYDFPLAAMDRPRENPKSR